MGTATYGGKGFKGKAAIGGDRPIGATSCRQQHNQASCQHSPPSTPRIVHVHPCGVGAHPLPSARTPQMHEEEILSEPAEYILPLLKRACNEFEPQRVLKFAFSFPVGCFSGRKGILLTWDEWDVQGPCAPGGRPHIPHPHGGEVFNKVSATGGGEGQLRQLLGTGNAQTASAATSTAPAHQPLGSANAATAPAGTRAAAADRTQRPDATCDGTERVTVQGPVKKPQPDGTSHTGGGGVTCRDGPESPTRSPSRQQRFGAWDAPDQTAAAARLMPVGPSCREVPESVGDRGCRGPQRSAVNPPPNGRGHTPNPGGHGPNSVRSGIRSASVMDPGPRPTPGRELGLGLSFGLGLGPGLGLGMSWDWGWYQGWIQ